MRIDWIGIDIDGVLADFVGMACRIHCRMDVVEHYRECAPGVWDTWRPMGITEEAFWHAIHYHAENFWRILPVYPWAQQLVDLCREVAHDRVAFVSTPSRSPFSAAGKLQWIERHFPDFSRRYFFCCDKRQLSGPGRLLIDDSYCNYMDWVNAGGVAFLWPQPWNVKHWFDGDRMDYLRAFLGLSTARAIPGFREILESAAVPKMDL